MTDAYSAEIQRGLVVVDWKWDPGEPHRFVWWVEWRRPLQATKGSRSIAAGTAPTYARALRACRAALRTLEARDLGEVAR